MGRRELMRQSYPDANARDFDRYVAVMDQSKVRSDALGRTYVLGRDNPSGPKDYTLCRLPPLARPPSVSDRRWRSEIGHSKDPVTFPAAGESVQLLDGLQLSVESVFTTVWSDKRMVAVLFLVEESKDD